MADEPSRGSGQFILNSLFAIRYSLFPHPSPTHRYAMDGAPAAHTLTSTSVTSGGEAFGIGSPNSCRSSRARAMASRMLASAS